MKISVSKDIKKLIVSFKYNSHTVEFVKALIGARWNPNNRYWTIANLKDNTDKLIKYGFKMDKKLEQYLKSLFAKKDKTIIEVPGFKKELYKFQKEGIAFVEDHDGRALIADECGLGKTWQALGYSQLYINDRPLLIVCPSNVKYNWKQEIENLMGNEIVCILSGRTTYSLKDKNGIFIINYDILHNWKEELKLKNFIIIIFDEAHRLKSHKALRTKAFKYITKNVDKLIFLTGTPIVNKPIEFFNILNKLRPDIFPNRFSFGKAWCNMHHNGFGWDFNGASNKEQLHRLLISTVMIRRLKKDVLKELPPKIITTIPMEIENRSEYNKAENEFINWLIENKGLAVAKKSKNAETLVKLGVLKRLTIEGKINNCVAWIEDFLESDEKLVIFTFHRETIRILMEKFGNLAVKIDGSTPAEKRAEIVNAFQTDDKIKLFIGNINAASEGITLTAASNVAFVELGWTPSIHDQAMDRCILEGQLVMTPDKGWIPIENIKKGDKIINGLGNTDKVIATACRHNNKINVEINVFNWLYPIKTTYDHKILIQEKNKFIWKKAIDIRPGNIIAQPIEQINKIKIEKIKVKKKYTLDTHFYNKWNILQRKSNKTNKIPKYIELNEMALFTFGYYIGDGFCNSEKIKNGTFISISGNNYSKVDSVNKCKKWFKSFSINGNTLNHKKDKGTETRFYSIEFAKFFTGEFGRICKEKYIPEWIFKLSNEQKSWFLEGLLKSDGYYRKKRWEYVTVSEPLVAGFSRLLMQLGYCPSINKGMDENWWVVGFSENKNKVRNLSVRSIKIHNPNRNKKLYDLELKKEPSFLIGTGIVHNCHRIGSTAECINVYYLLAKDTIEMKIAKLIDKKRKVIDQILDGKKPDEASMISELFEDMMK